MMDFIKEFWLWMLIPFVLVLAGLGILFLATSGGDGSPFTYDVF